MAIVETVVVDALGGIAVGIFVKVVKSEIKNENLPQNSTAGLQVLAVGKVSAVNVVWAAQCKPASILGHNTFYECRGRVRCNMLGWFTRVITWVSVKFLQDPQFIMKHR